MWDGMTGSVHDMELAYERELDRRMDEFYDYGNREDDEEYEHTLAEDTGI